MGTLLPKSTCIQLPNTHSLIVSDERQLLVKHFNRPNFSMSDLHHLNGVNNFSTRDRKGDTQRILQQKLTICPISIRFVFRHSERVFCWYEAVEMVLKFLKEEFSAKIIRSKQLHKKVGHGQSGSNSNQIRLYQTSYQVA